MYGEHSVGRGGIAAQGTAQLAEGTLVLDYEAAAGTTVAAASHATPAASPLAPSPASARAVAVAVRSSPLGVGVGVGGAAASSSPAAPQVR